MLLLLLEPLLVPLPPAPVLVPVELLVPVSVVEGGFVVGGVGAPSQMHGPRS